MSEQFIGEQTTKHFVIQKLRSASLSHPISPPSSSISSILIAHCPPKSLKSGLWTDAETNMLRSAVENYGMHEWKKCSVYLGTRTAKQCRDRWFNCLQPDMDKTPFSEKEDQVIIEQRKKIGNQWSMIAELLSKRTPSSVKNRWYSHLSKISSL